MDPALALVLAAFAGSGTLAAIAAKYFRPAPTLTETVAAQAQQIKELQDEARTDRDASNMTQDYVHELRAWISDSKPPPPPPWPEGLKR